MQVNYSNNLVDFFHITENKPEVHIQTEIEKGKFSKEIHFFLTYYAHHCEHMASHKPIRSDTIATCSCFHQCCDNLMI